MTSKSNLRREDDGGEIVGSLTHPDGIIEDLPTVVEVSTSTDKLGQTNKRVIFPSTSRESPNITTSPTPDLMSSFDGSITPVVPKMLSLTPEVKFFFDLEIFTIFFGK